MFITLEDESGIANLVVWTKVFEQHRRIVLSSGMIAVKGRVQREGEVVHLVAHRITDLSARAGQRRRSRTRRFRCRMDAGTSSTTGRRRPIRAVCRRRGCARATYIFLIFTSTRSR